MIVCDPIRSHSPHSRAGERSSGLIRHGISGATEWYASVTIPFSNLVCRAAGGCSGSIGMLGDEGNMISGESGSNILGAGINDILGFQI